MSWLRSKLLARALEGVAANMAWVFPRPVVTILVSHLFVADMVNLGADLAAMGAATRLVTGLMEHLLAASFALISLGLYVIHAATLLDARWRAARPMRRSLGKTQPRQAMLTPRNIVF